ncbi:serine protease [Actinoplanes bogorensis]|uniref:Serine protease n=1 Tax=Paractinoplanes bogorensis TaxID=1610840 RepID=A0ABS5YWJ7_9ACTN|nr:serine protease [Actinoplanes bogorensis]MBU2667810.1 serine protease [Actinoplanes bogorensis]
MSAPAIPFDELRHLLKRCVALVVVDGSPIGTAFFVDDRRLLTCEHVLTGTRVQVRPWDRNAGESEILEVIDIVSDEVHDLALLTVDAPKKAGSRTAVLLGTSLLNAQYCVAGYRDIAGYEPALEAPDAVGDPREQAPGQPQTLELRNIWISGGLSGGPVMNLTTGAVVAVTRLAHYLDNNVGGAGTPVSQVFQSFPALRSYQSQPPVEARAWRELLGKAKWEALGLSWATESTVNLYVSGDLRRWRIGLGHEGLSPDDDITGNNLGEEIAEALFRWARRRRVRDKAEVALLGRLLASALFPGRVGEELQRLALADSTLIRLHVENENELADIPWELAAVPGSNKGYLSTNERIQFTRAIPNTDDEYQGSWLEQTSETVLPVIAQPPEWADSYPAICHARRQIPWPKEDELRSNLEGCLERNGIEFRRAALNPRYTDVEANFSKHEYAAFHYVGFGKVEDDVAHMTFVENGDPQWKEVAEVLTAAGEGGIRLVVLEFGMPPEVQELKPISPSSLGNCLPSGIQAVVVTSYPVHPRQYWRFDSGFYEALGKERTSVESAVQRGRRLVSKDSPVEDAAGFGWFTLLTAGRNGLHLRPPLPTGPASELSTQQTQIPPRVNKPVGTSATERTDEFLR